MDTEKNGLEKQNSRSHFLETGLATGLIAITLALVLLTIFGSLYVHKLQTECKSEAVTPNYGKQQSITYNGHTENVMVDKENQIERFINKDERGNIQSVAVINFHSRLISIYIPNMDKCYLIGGIVQELGSFEKSLLIIQQKEQVESVSNTTAVFILLDKEPVKDKSLLTSDMKSYCSDYNMFWLDRSDESHASRRREKRDTVFRFRLGPFVIEVTWDPRTVPGPSTSPSMLSQGGSLSQFGHTSTTRPSQFELQPQVHPGPITWT